MPSAHSRSGPRFPASAGGTGRDPRTPKQRYALPPEKTITEPFWDYITSLNMGTYILILHLPNPVTSMLFSTLKGARGLSCTRFLVKTNLLSQWLEARSKMSSSMKCDFLEVFFPLVFFNLQKVQVLTRFLHFLPQPLHPSHIPGSLLLVPPEHLGKRCTHVPTHRCAGAKGPKPTKRLQSSPYIGSLS